MISLINSRRGRGFAEKFDEGSIGELAEIICSKDWCPGVFDSTEIRQKKHWVESRIFAIDVDDGQTLEWAISQVQGCMHIVATSKSHQKMKRGKVCDRYRILLFAHKNLDDISVYEYNLKRITAHFQGDRSCTHAAALFNPCIEVQSINEYGRFAKIQTVLPKTPERRFEPAKRVIPKIVESIIYDGVLINDSRHHTIFFVGAELTRRKWNLEEIRTLVFKLPFINQLVEDDSIDEIERHIENGRKAGIRQFDHSPQRSNAP